MRNNIKNLWMIYCFALDYSPKDSFCFFFGHLGYFRGYLRRIWKIPYNTPFP